MPSLLLNVTAPTQLQWPSKGQTGTAVNFTRITELLKVGCIKLSMRRSSALGWAQLQLQWYASLHMRSWSADTHSTGPSLSQPAISSATPNGRLCSSTAAQQVRTETAAKWHVHLACSWPAASSKHTHPVRHIDPLNPCTDTAA
jgi:hypothetical protein